MRAARTSAFTPSIVDVAGINSISRAIYTNAAGAIVGAVQMDRPAAKSEKPLIAASMFGNTTQCVDHARGQPKPQATRCWSFTPPALAAKSWRA